MRKYFQQAWTWLKQQDISTDQIWTAAVILLVLSLVLLVGFWVWTRWRVKKLEENPDQIPDFKKIWRSFTTHIPSEFVHSIQLFQHFVTLGDSGSGKSLLVDLYTDWQGQARQFYPSYASDPDLQVFLGSQLIVQELPSPLLNNVDPELRKSLDKHWRSLYKQRNPIVVVAVNGSSLTSMTPESLKQQAQLIRGKINILSKIRRATVETRIVLTHMDEVEGYEEFTAFLRENRIPFTIELKQANDTSGLDKCLIPYEQHLNRLLTQVPGRDFMSSLAFLQNGPTLFARAGEFINILTESDPLSYEPRVTEVFLSSSTSQRESTNPYHLTDEAVRFKATERPNFKHRLFCLVTAVAIMGYLFTNFVIERYHWSNARLAITALGAAQDDDISSDSEAMYERSLKFLEQVDTLKLREYLRYEAEDTGFYYDAEMARLRLRFVEVIREGLLRPKFQAFLDPTLLSQKSIRGQNKIDGNEKALYVLALLYATNDNDLGRRIAQSAKLWENEIGLHSIVINDLVSFAEAVPDSPPEKLNQVLESIPAFENQTTFTPWIAYLQTISPLMSDEALSNPLARLTTPELNRLQRQAEKLELEFRRTRRWFLALELASSRTLRSIASVKKTYDRLVGNYSLGEWISSNENDIQKLFQAVSEAEIESLTDPGAMSLSEFIDYVTASMQLETFTGENLQIVVDRRKFGLNLGAWKRTLYRSRVNKLLGNFVTAVRLRKGGLFFADPELYPDIVLNSTNDGTFVFEGRLRIEGHYTRIAFDREVGRSAKLLEPFIQELGNLIDPTMQNTLRNQFGQELGVYGTRYLREYMRFYRSFRVEAQSTPGLLLALQQMQLPISPFSGFLKILRDNTRLRASDQPKEVLSFVKKLQVFEPINRLYDKPEKGKPEIDRYMAILANIEAGLAGEELEDPKQKPAPPLVQQGGGGKAGPSEAERKAFKDQLSPAGAMALEILKKRRDSYLRLTIRWLASAGIKPKLMRPFIEVIEELYEIGLQDIEENIEKNWRITVYPIISEQMKLFPFDKKQAFPVNPLKLTKTLKPNGEFWKKFYKLAAPVLLKSGNQWIEPQPYLRPVKLPKDMVARVNFCQKLADTLWSEAGKPQPVLFRMKPRVLQKGLFDRPYSTVSYVSVGSASVFGFNQTPQFMDLKFEWWKRQTAEVGLQLVSRDDRTKVYMKNVVSNEIWALFRLIDKGEELEDNVLTWRVRADGLVPQKIEFEFQADPWDLFRFEREETPDAIQPGGSR